MLDSSILEQFSTIVGDINALHPERDFIEPYLTESRGLFTGLAALVLRPANVTEVAAIVSLAAQERIGLVPQGGRSGRVAGTVPSASGDEIVVSLERMNSIRSFDMFGKTMTVDAGTPLETAQNAARDVGLLLPINHGARGTSQIGGNVATNAGGSNVLRYGNTRELVAGLEVVLPSGEIWNGLRTLRKDNSGYDLKQMFIGSEGTLGIITSAVLRLSPLPQNTHSAFLAIPNIDAVLNCFDTLQKALPELTAFELMPTSAISYVASSLGDTRTPINPECEWTVLAEISSRCDDDHIQHSFYKSLDRTVSSADVEAVYLSGSSSQREDMWKLRDLLPEKTTELGPSVRHDISIPIGSIAEFLQTTESVIRSTCPAARIIPYGHIGDGNLHYTVIAPSEYAPEDFESIRTRLNNIIYEQAVRYDGSIAAEHGIGLAKKKALVQAKSEIELRLMRQIKSTLDPLGIMNPGKIL